MYTKNIKVLKGIIMMALRKRMKFLLLLVVLLVIVFIARSSNWRKLHTQDFNVDFDRKGNRDTGISSRKTTTVPENVPKFILINTYMRSGSTILGSLLGHHDSAFYFYEPLQRILRFEYINGTKVCDYYKPQCRDGHSTKNASLEYVSDLFNCRLRRNAGRFDPNVHFSGGHLGPKWQAYQSCKEERNSTVDKCLGVMESICAESSYHVIKSLRFTLKDAAQLLEVNLNLFIFQLLRDPRAIINSHIFTSWYPVSKSNLKTIREDAIVQCDRIRNDIRAGRELMARYPDRLRFLQYEDYATDTSKIRSLYKLIGADNIDKFDAFMNKTAQKKFDGRKIEKASSKFPKQFGYRDGLSFDIVRVIQEQCEDVIQQLGLKLFRTEDELRNPDIKSIPSRLLFEIKN